jgi:hypothetical protein
VENIGLGYKCSPRRPNVSSGYEISGSGIAARNAGERRLGFAIGLVGKVALWATPAGVARIDGNDRDTRKPRLIGHKLAKLTERPPMQTAALPDCRMRKNG